MGRKRILLVDDSETVLRAEELILRHEDVELLTACDGEEAVLTAETEQPDLILMDLVMPRMNGLAACRKLREQDATEFVPVIMVTSKGEPQLVEAAYAAGCNDYITKPINGPELIAKVRNLLRNNHAE